MSFGGDPNEVKVPASKARARIAGLGVIFFVSESLYNVQMVIDARARTNVLEG